MIAPLQPAATDVARANATQLDPLNAFLAPRWLHDGSLVNRDLSLARGFRLDTPFAHTSSPATLDTVFLAVRNALNTLPAHFDVQVVWTAHHDLSRLIDQCRADTHTHDPLLSAFANEQIDTLTHRARNAELRFFHPYLFLIRHSSLSEASARRAALRYAQTHQKWSWFDSLRFQARLMFSTHDLLYQHEYDTFLQDADELMRVATAISRALDGAGCPTTPLSDQDILDLIYRRWNSRLYDAGVRPEPYNPALLRSLSTYVLTDHLTIDPTTGFFYYGGFYHATSTMSLPPETFFTPQDPLSTWDSLLAFTRRSRIAVILHATQGNIEKRKAHLNEKLSLFREMAKRKKELAIVAAEVERELLTLQQGQEKFWLAQITAHLWNTSPDGLAADLRDFQLEAKRASGLDMVPEKHASFHYYCATQPGWSRDKDRFRLLPCSTSQLVALAPTVHDPSMIGSRIGAILETFSGSPLNFNPFDDRQYANANGIIAGGSGFGKTFLVQSLIAQFLARGHRIFVIDPKGDFEGLTRSVGGSYLVYRLDGTDMRINPLALNANADTPTNEELTQMLAWLESLLVDTSIAPRLSAEDLANLETLLTQAFRKAQGTEIFLRDLQRLLNNTPGCTHLATRMVPWVTTGSRANLFDGTTQPDFSRKLTVFDLGHIKDRLDLARVALMSIMAQIRLLAKRDPSTRYLLFLDECWALLKDPVVAGFVESEFRLARSLGGGVFGISQGMTEWSSLPNADAIIQNTSHHILLRQASETSITEAAAKLALNPKEVAYLRGLQTVKGSYSQQLFHHVMATGGYRSSLVLTRPWPLLYAICTSNPRDKDAKRLLAESGLSFPEVIKEFARRYPQGV